MNTHHLVNAGLFTVLLAATGCIHGNYRVVKTAGSAGEIALEGPQEEARQKADGYMASRCPSGVVIVEEGETVVGQDASSQTRRGTTFGVVPTTNTQSTTTDKREWRIKYECKGTNTAAPEQKASPPAAPQGKVEEIVIYF